MSFKVNINDNVKSQDDIDTTLRVVDFVALEAVEPTGSVDIPTVVSPDNSILVKLMDNASVNDELDMENRKKIVKELETAGYDVGDNGKNPDGLDKSEASKLNQPGEPGAEPGTNI